MTGNLEWGFFTFDELFYISKGQRLTKENMVDGRVNFIGAISYNNGIRERIDVEPLHLGNCITVNYNGSVGEAFYQSEPFWASDDVNILELKSRSLNRNIGLFLCTIIKQSRYRFSYGRKWKVDLMKSSTLFLPVDSKHSPNWKFMEEFIENLGLQPIKTSIDEGQCISISNRVKKFPLVDYFDMMAGKYYYPDEFGEGITPYVSASDANNGIMQFIDLPPDFPGNTITIGKVGISTFYQPEPFCATSDVTILKPKFEMNKYIGLYLRTVISKEKFRWSYGRQIRLGDCQELEVYLPSNENGEPDWEYMEEFIHHTKFSDRI